jgi:membrane protein
MTKRDKPVSREAPPRGDDHDPNWPLQSDRGRFARRPGEIPLRGWKDILLRVWKEIDEDRIDLVAAGVAFWLILGLFPALGAIVAVYGLIADPATLRDHLASLDGIVPDGGMEVLEDQVNRLIEQNDSSLSLAALLGFLIAIWSTNTAMKALFSALNVAYGEREKRGWIGLTLLTLMFTVAALVLAVLLLAVIAAVPLALEFLRLPSDVEWIIFFVRWPLMVVLVMAGLAILYRYGPSRRDAKWRWVTWGSALTAVIWLVVSIGYSWYLANFTSYDRTYGSLGAVVGFMMWIWVSVLVMLVGAELNAEMEHQTAVDSTTSEPSRPLGRRGARMADTVGAAADASGGDDEPAQPKR